MVAFKRGVCRPGWPRFVTAGWWRLQAMKPRYTATSRLQDGGGLRAGSLQATGRAAQTASGDGDCSLWSRATLSPAKCRSPQRKG